MQPVVFLEKVRRPDPRGLVRPRLEECLLATDSPLGLVLGPPGSGKSTLLGRVAARSAVPTAWYRVSEEDRTEEALVRHLVAALGQIPSAPPRTAPADTSEAGSVSALVAALESGPGEPRRIVVDDLHEIAGTPAERALERLLALRPRHLRLLLGSRRPPAVNISRLLVSGDLCQLDSDDLRFRSWEVEELFRTVYDQPLSPETAAALTRRTGGWAAGLQLFHLATGGLDRLDRERAVDELSGRSRLIRSYLARNVLDGLDAERRSFLIRTCALGLLSGDLCDALLGTTGGTAVLADLEQQQFFTTSTDGGRTYRYHQVLQTHLEIVLADELGMSGARALYVDAARLLEQAGRTAAAVRAHARAEDWGAVARLLQQSSLALPGVDDALWTARPWPGAPDDDPSMVLAGARRLLRNGLVSDAVAAFGHAESLTDDPDFSARCAAQRQQAAVWLPGDQQADQRADHRTGHRAGREPPGPPPVSREHRLSEELRELTRSVRDPDAASTALARGLGHLLAGDTVAAAQALKSGLDDPGLPVWERLAARLVIPVGELRRWSSPSGLLVQLEEIVLTADLEGLPWVSRIARGLQAAVQLAGQPTPWRLAGGADLLADCERHGDRWTLCVLATVLGAAYAFAGHDDRAAEPLRRAETAARELDAPVLGIWATAFRTAVGVRMGDPEAVQTRAEIARRAHDLGAVGAALLLRPGGLTPGPPDVTPDGAARPRGAPGVTPAGAALRMRAPDEAVRRMGPQGTTGASPVRRVELRCLGQFGLVVDGLVIDPVVLRPRVRSVLMVLALHHGRSVHRELLVDALWPDATLAAGVRSLQVAVSSIRQWLASARLPEDGLRRYGDAYVLELATTTDDLRDLERLVRKGERLAGDGAAAALRAKLDAVATYTGPLLPEAGPAEWVVDERDRWQALAARVAAEAGQLGLELGELAAGCRAAQRSVELDPYHDIAWRVLAAAHERLGDLSAAAVTRREHARLLCDLGLPAPYRSGPDGSGPGSSGPAGGGPGGIRPVVTARPGPGPEQRGSGPGAVRGRA